MAKITRRKLFGLVGGTAGLAACAAPDARDGAKPELYSGSVSFNHGVASGDPLSDRVILWTRVTPAADESGPIPVTWTIYAEDGERVIDARSVETSAATDFCVKIDAEGLEPGTVYLYEFAVNTPSGPITSPRGRTKTTSASGGAPVVLAAVSCSNWHFGYFNGYAVLAERNDLDAIVHLGDYFYEYGIDGYGAETAQKLGRLHDPITETVTLADYRMRHAQYKTDADLQAAHAAAPWICTWDDHESTNNSYRTGAQNHNPEEGEGDWSDRKQVAVQAYLEWMPVRDPQRGEFRESIYRTFQFGDVATVFALESRLTGRSDEISWFTEIGGLEPAQVPMAAMRTMARVTDPTRTLLGDVQEEWLADGLKDSASNGVAWQVLANQVVMARVRPPNFRQTLSDEQIAAQDVGYIQQLIEFSQLGMPWNLDAWDGFPAARDRLYSDAKDAGARLVTLTGDTHTAWANTLVDKDGERRGVEFGCTSITSPGFGTYVRDIPDVGSLFVEANPEVDHYDPFGSGVTVVTLTPDTVSAEYHKVSTVETREYQVADAGVFESRRDGDGLTALTRKI